MKICAQKCQKLIEKQKQYFTEVFKKKEPENLDFLEENPENLDEIINEFNSNLEKKSSSFYNLQSDIRKNIRNEKIQEKKV